MLLRPPLLHADTRWALGLLCFLLRDGLEGDLRLGWGRARGYGRIRLLQAEAGDPATPWPDVLARLEQTLGEHVQGSARDWAEALEQEIDRRLEQAPQAPEASEP